MSRSVQILSPIGKHLPVLVCKLFGSCRDICIVCHSHACIILNVTVDIVIKLCHPYSGLYIHHQ